MNKLSTDDKRSRISIGIDPAGIGTTGIFLKTYKTKWPIRKHIQLKSDNPVEAALKIQSEIKKFQEVNNFILIEVIVIENLHQGPEKMKEVKATRELIGILRYIYDTKIRLHKPSDKDKIRVKKLLEEFGQKNEHAIHAQTILEAHLLEKERGLKCELWNWEEIKYGS